MSESIAKDRVVSISYTLQNTEGEILDQTGPEQTFEYLHGYENIIPGLETALEGLKVGDSKQVTVEPEEGYGDFDENLVIKVPLSELPDEKAESGMEFEATTEQGVIVFTVIDIEGSDAILDGNHPLAGETLIFDVEVKGVREATSEELEHGHVHGEDGHHH